MQTSLRNLASVSFLFLVALGGLHISSTFLLMQGVQSSSLLLLFQALDLPFLLSALLYGSAQFSLAMEDISEKGKEAFIASMAFSAILFCAALYLNFALPDVRLF